MIPQGVEVRPELQLRSDVLAFGFSGKGADSAAVSLLGKYILTNVDSASPGLVVVDMRNVEFLSSTGLGHLLAIHKRLKQVGWKLLLLIHDPLIREFFSSTNLDQVFLVAATEAELRELVESVTLVPTASPSQDEAIEFSESELAEMDATGITLDDAIRAVEGMRR